MYAASERVYEFWLSRSRAEIKYCLSEEGKDRGEMRCILLLSWGGQKGYL